MEVGYAVNNLGILAMEQGEAAEAERNFREYNAVTTRLAEEQPNDPQRLIEVGQSYAWLADALDKQLKFTAAMRTRQMEISFYNRSLAEQGENAEIKPALSVAYFRLAQIEIATGRVYQAFDHAVTATRMADQLLAADWRNSDQMTRTASAYTVLGETYLHLRRYPEARLSLAKSIELAEQLVARDGDVAEWKGHTLASAKLVLARTEVEEGDSQGAIILFGEVASALGTMINSKMTTPYVVRNYCAALAGRARLDQVYKGDRTRIIDLLVPDSLKLGPESLVLLAEAYAHTGNNYEGRAAASKLYAAGYRHPDFVALIQEFPELKPSAEGAAAAQ